MKKLVLLVALVALLGLIAACASPTPAVAPTSAPSSSSATAAVTGSITIWNGYHTGDNEEKTLNQLLDAAKKAYPDAKITVLEIPFDQLFNKFETEAATGGGPDMYIAPNDSLGKEARAGLLAPLDSMLTGKLDPFSKLSVQGVTVDGKIYAVPMVPKALAMYYNKTTVTAVPATTDDLLAAVKAGKKVGIPNSAYHTFGWWRAFGGSLMDASGKCVADQAGVADAYTYLMSLKAAGAQIRADTDLDTLYRQGQLDIYFNGPWVLGGNEDGLGKDKVGVAPMPKGPKGDAGPMAGIDGWYVNANSKNKQSVVNLALFFASKDSQTVYANVAGDPAARTDVVPTDLNVKAFADAASAGFPRPQVAQLDNFWGPFGDAATKIFEGTAKPADAITAACAQMNTANKITAAPASSASSAAKFTCTDKLGCVDIGPNDPVHIAYAFVTSGDNSTLGLDTKYGAELAIDDAGGKVLGHTIKFDGQDSGCSPEGGQAAAAKLAADKTIVAVIGTNCSSEARAAAPILLTQSGLSMISPSNTAVDLTDPAKHVAGYFRTAHNDKVQGAVAADFVVKQLKITKAATINDGSIYAQGLAAVFEAQFKADGGTITASEAVNVGDKDMKPVLTRIATGKPDLIYYPIFIAEGGFIASQIRDVPGLEKTAMMGADGIFSPDFLKAGGKNTIGMFWSSPNFSAFGSGYQKLVDAYLKKYNVKGTLAPFHAHSYDAMNMVLAALQKPNVVAKDADGTLHVQKQALRDAIAATDMQGITGHIKCDAYGDCADPKIAIYQASADDFNGGTMPKLPVWAPGGADYKAPGTASSSAASSVASAAPTAIPPKCDKMATAMSPKAGDLGSSTNPIVVEFVPSVDVGLITKGGTAMADCLGKMTGLTFKVEAGTSEAASIEAMGAGKAQMGFLNTFSVLLAYQKYQVDVALVAQRKYGYQNPVGTYKAFDFDPDKAMAGQLSSFYKPEYFTKAGSTIKSLTDIKGKSMCFTSAGSTSGGIVPRIAFKALGIDPDKDMKSTYAGGHDKAAIAVYQGDCEAGVAFMDILTDPPTNLAKTFPDIAQKVTVFAVGDRIPNDGLQFIKTLDPSYKSLITDALMAMMADPGGNAVVKGIYSYDAFEKADYNKYYAPFAAMLKAAGVDVASLVKQ